MKKVYCNYIGNLNVERISEDEVLFVSFYLVGRWGERV